MALSAEGLRERDEGLGGTDLAALLGKDPFNSAADVLAKKRGLPSKPSERFSAAWWGNAAEPLIGQIYQSIEKVQLIWNPPTLRDPEEPWRLGHADWLRYDGNGVDAKTCNSFVAEEWGKPGTDEIPDRAYIQGQWYMSLAPRARFWDFPLLVWRDQGPEYRRYRIFAEPDFQRFLVEVGRFFWFEHVVGGKPLPASAYGDDADAYLRTRYGRGNGRMLAAGAELAELVAKYRDGSELVKGAELQLKALRGSIKEAIGDNDGAEGLSEDGSAWRIYYRAAKEDRFETDWEAVALECGAPADMIQRHTRKVEPERRFSPHFGLKSLAANNGRKPKETRR